MEQDLGTPGQGTVPVANVPCPGIIWSVHVYEHQLTQGPWSWGIPRSIYARVRGLVFKFKNARDLNGVKNRHLRLFLDHIGCDRSNDTSLFNVLQTADFSTVTGIHHVVVVRFANFLTCFLPRHGFKLTGLSSKILGIRSHLHALIIEAVFIVESIWKPTILVRGRFMPIARHYERIVCVPEVTSLCTRQWRRLFSLASLVTSN